MTLPFRVMGVVNVTPDSFSDGGAFLDARAAIAHARELVAQGADILDVGGESTRPGAEPVSADEELRRVLPVLEGIAAADLDAQVSIDTSKASVARAAIAAGAEIVNDVSALRADPAMVELIAGSGVQCCLMHMLGEPRTMQSDPRYADVVDEVKAFLEGRLGFAVRAGVDEERIMLDPGIGFGKTVAHNLELLERLGELTALGRPLVVGTSRKGFIGRILADAAGEAESVDVTRRLPGTIATNVLALERGASVFRVHDVAPVRDALAVAAATLGERWTARVGTTTQTS
ncbi:MAG: dihydropteroate synthase [Solirubrobacteraceae bacterium]